MTTEELEQFEKLLDKHFDPIVARLENIDNRLKRILDGDYPCGYIKIDKKYIIEGTKLIGDK